MIDVLLRTALTGSAVTLAWLAVNALLGKRLPALWHYRVLKLALFLFLVPVWPLASLAAKLPARLAFTAPVTAPEAAPAPQIPVTALPTAPAVPAAPLPETAPVALSVDLFQILTAVWAIGAAAVLGYKLWVYIRFRRSILRQNRPVSDPEIQAVFNECKTQLGLRRAVALRENPLVPTPLSTGLLRPVVVLPVLPLCREELRFLFLHELTHIKRHDLWVRFFAMLAAALHWYDPLVYLLNKQIKNLSEQGCDERVSAPLDRAGRFAYGSVLLKLAADTVAGPCEWAVTLSAKDTIERRLIRVLHSEKLKGRKRLLALALAAAILACGTAAALAARSPLVRRETGPDTQTVQNENAALRELSADRVGQKEADAAVWFTPEDIHDIESAELVWWDGTVYATLDEGAPAYLETLLGGASAVKSSGCPFHSVLYLRRADGVVGKVLPAEDSCDVFQSDGAYYDFNAGDNAVFYALFGVSTAELPLYTSAAAQQPEDADVPAETAAPQPETADSTVLHPDALRGDTALIMSRGGTLLPDDDPSSYVSYISADGSKVYSKQFTGKNGYRHEEYLVGNREALLANETRKNAQGAEERVDRWLSELVNGEYPKNKNGESYGIVSLADYVGYMPDLYSVLNPDTGVSGYVRWKDVPGANVKTPEEALAYMEWREANPGPYQLPMYDAKGDQIGYWEMGGSDDSVDTTGMTIEEAKEAVANAGSSPYPDAVRGDTDLIMSRGGTLLPDDEESSYRIVDGVAYKRFLGKDNYGYLEYVVGNEDYLREEWGDYWADLMLATLVDGDYPKNSKGESYGDLELQYYVGYAPDLHRNSGTHGEPGYTRLADEAIPNLPEAECPHEFLIPLYDSEGNEIGKCDLNCNGHIIEKGMTIEEAKAALANGTL